MKKSFIVFVLLLFFKTLLGQTPGGPDGPGGPPDDDPDVGDECVTPGTPNGLEISEINHNSAMLSWTIGDPEGSDTVSYYWVVDINNEVLYGYGTSQGYTSNTNTIATGLEPNTTYYFRVYAETNCGEGSKSDYATSIQFTTNQDYVNIINKNYNKISVWSNNNTLFVNTPKNEIIEEIIIYNMLGSIVLQSKTKQTDLSSLNKSMYIIYVKTNKQIKSQKILIE